MPLSEKAQQLISQARIVSFRSWPSSLNSEAIAIFQQADDQGRYLNDEELAYLVALAPNLSSAVEQARLLREKAPNLIAAAREQILSKFPQITEPGGGLYPPERAEACWRDFWHFLRCITYGIAGQQTDFLSQEGLTNMKLLYQEMQVPLDALLWGLENLQAASLEQFPQQEQPLLVPYFERLKTSLKQFGH